MAAAIALNLVVLGVFKYAYFAVTNVNAAFGTDFTLGSIILPLGISFFTFEQISFLVDVRRGQTRPSLYVHYALFVSFFPRLVAGPIIRYNEIAPQFDSPRPVARLRRGSRGRPHDVLDRPVEKSGSRRWGRAVCIAGIRRGGARRGDRSSDGLGRSLRLYVPAVFRFFRIFRHGDRRGALLWHSLPDEFRFALQIHQHCRVLAALAHHPVALFARLFVFRPWRQSAWPGAALSEPAHNDAFGRPVARGQLDVHRVGSAARRLPDDQPRLARHRRAVAGIDGVQALAVGRCLRSDIDVPRRRRRLGFLPGPQLSRAPSIFSPEWRACTASRYRRVWHSP